MKHIFQETEALIRRLAERAPAHEDPPPAPPTGEELWNHHLRCCEVPPRYRMVPRSLAVHPEAAEWQGSGFLTFLGPVGSGKTWQATFVLGCLHEAGGRGLLWIDAAEAVERIRQEIATDHDGRTLGRMREASVLLLDDLLAERDSDFARDKLGLVLRHRHAQMAPTIITSNSTDPQGRASLAAIEALEPRLASRIAEGLVIKLGGRDRRLTRKASETPHP